MREIEPRCAGDGIDPFQPPRAERRSPGRSASHGSPTALPNPASDCEPSRHGLIERVLIRFGLIGPQPSTSKTEPARVSRGARLQSIAFRLEAILGELDELGSQRTAIDVCMALERIKAHLADCEVGDSMSADGSVGCFAGGRGEHET